MDKKLELLFGLLKIINVNVNNIDELIDLSIEQQLLRNPAIIEKYYKFMPSLKKEYNSEMLTCLHKNSLNKQRFPAINTIRQILKCNNLRLKPYTVSKGYEKSTGKKIVERFYVIKYLE